MSQVTAANLLVGFGYSHRVTSIGGQRATSEGAGMVTTDGAIRADQLQISPGALSLHRIVRTWTALSGLFGKPATRGRGPTMPDLLAIRETLREAQRNLAELRDRQGVLDTLKSSALRGAEQLVEEFYGLRGDGANLSVVLEPDMGGALASVSYRYDGHGRMVNQHLNINMKAFTPDTGPNGLNGRPLENDRIVAHEMTHAIMGRNMDIRVLPEWFMEGTAEYIAGGAERVANVRRHLSPQALLIRVQHPWAGDNSQYAASYLAVRYLDHLASGNGGLRMLMGYLKEGYSLDHAISQVTDGALPNEEEFLTHFVASGAGLAFMNAVDLSGRDPGSIKSGRGPDIVPDNRRRSSQPLRGFHIDWPSPVPAPVFRPIFPPVWAANRMPVTAQIFDPSWAVYRSLAYPTHKAYNHRTRSG